jgi:hypothetical protein
VRGGGRGGGGGGLERGGGNLYCTGADGISTVLVPPLMGTVESATVAVQYSIDSLPLSPAPYLSCPHVHSKNQQRSERYIIKLSAT